MSVGFRAPLPLPGLGNAGTTGGVVPPGPATVGFRLPFPYLLGLAGVGEAVAEARYGTLRFELEQAFQRRPAQFAQLHPFVELDAFGRLTARRARDPQAAVLAAWGEPDVWTALAARGQYQAVLAALEDEEAVVVRARRGLPSREVLAFFLDQV